MRKGCLGTNPWLGGYIYFFGVLAALVAGGGLLVLAIVLRSSEALDAVTIYSAAQIVIGALSGNIVLQENSINQPLEIALYAASVRVRATRPPARGVCGPDPSVPPRTPCAAESAAGGACLQVGVILAGLALLACKETGWPVQLDDRELDGAVLCGGCSRWSDGLLGRPSSSDAKRPQALENSPLRTSQTDAGGAPQYGSADPAGSAPPSS